METIDKMIAIREKQGISLSEMARRMGYDKSALSRYEAKKRPLPPEAVKSFKHALGAPLLPLTDEEEAHFKETLYQWKGSINRNEIEDTANLQPQLARVAELTTNRDLYTLYKMFLMIFYARTDNPEFIAILTSFEKETANLSNEHSYWYYRMVGYEKISKNHYRSAVDAYFKAEAHGNTLGLTDASLYYHIGHCLTEMGYTYQAIHYFEKAQMLPLDETAHLLSVYIRYFIAENYMYIGREQEALKILEACLMEEKNKKNATTTIGLIYRRIARVYLQMNNLEAALENIEMAFNYIKPENGSYNRTLYYKAKILIADNKFDEFNACLNKVINRKTNDPCEYVILSAFKHEQSINEKASRKYLEETAIPVLLKHGRNLHLLDCYQALLNFYEKNNKSKALKYAMLAYTLSEKLRKGDLSA